MFIIQIKFLNEWATYCRCVTPRADRTEFMSKAASKRLLKFYQARYAWSLRLACV